MKVLLVAPTIVGLPALGVWKEKDKIGDMDGVNLEVLTGPNVTRDRVSKRLERPYEVVIFAGHGQPGRFIVSDGKLTSNWMARYVKGASPKIVLLIACYSAAHYSALQNMAQEISAANVPVIAMSTVVDDGAATIYTVEFMRAFAGGASIREAHTIGLEQMETRTNPGQMPMFLPGLNGSVASSLGRLETKFEEQCNGINHRMDRMLSEQGSLAVRMGDLEAGLTKLSGG